MTDPADDDDAADQPITVEVRMAEVPVNTLNLLVEAAQYAAAKLERSAKTDSASCSRCERWERIETRLCEDHTSDLNRAIKFLAAINAATSAVRRATD